MRNNLNLHICILRLLLSDSLRITELEVFVALEAWPVKADCGLLLPLSFLITFFLMYS